MEWTTFQNKYATTATAVEGTLQDFFNMLRDAGPYKNKDMCKWVKLARFGEKRTADNSLRHNENVLAITGVEGDYDGELIQPEEVIKKLEAAQIRAIVYTSPSYTPEKPRWRVIAPCSKEMPTAWRDILLSRINGVLGGILANESFTLSQSYYFGQVEGAEYRVLATFDDLEDGYCIDDLPMLDDIAIGKKNAPQTAEDAPYSQDTIAKKVQELGRKLRTGDGRRDLLKSHIASASGRGIRSEADLMTLVHGVAAQFFDPADPFDPKDVGEIVAWAAGKDKAAAAEAARMVAGLMPAIPPEQHPLAQFVEIDTKPRAVDWVIPGLIASGVVTISGARGVGKTTAILPLAMAAAGLHAQGYALAPKPGRWRHVIYVVEDIAQAQRIVAGMVGHSNLGLRMEVVRERLHLVEAKRLDPKIVVEVGELYRAKFTRTVDGVEIPPLVVFDTKSAVLAMESENDNSEASRAVALLKEKFADLPTWVVGHIAKTLTGSQDVDSLSDRGAGAFEADAVQNLYLIKQQGTRILLLGKKRFHSPWRELPVECHSAEVLATDAWGDTEVTLLLWGIVAPTVESRQEASEDAAKEEAAAREAEARKKAMEAVHGAWKLGQPLNRTALKSRIGMKAQEAVGLIDALLCEGHLASVTVPAKERTNPKRSEYLIYLDATERAAYIDTGALPRAKTVPPASWRKGLPAVCDSEIPFVPDDENETGEILQASEVEA